ncbi:unnamed protein product [Trifolium pratense]|uniref:Uncharacterized protein n=1 Tax=Trifolium pratense TaxID=57577 RepID=A0ACB0ISI3_TRIPR|nr:unnamed protein product [Trifolium pratense]
MATTLQSLRFPFHPSITPPNSHTFPATTLHYSPKSITFKDSFLVTRNKRGFSSNASSSQYSPTVAENLGDVSIFTAAGEPVMFKDLWDQNQLPFPMDCLYADPDRKAYDFLDLYYGFGRTFFNPASAKVLSRFDALQKAVKNYTIDATPDDRRGVLQQGGMFVFRGKELLYARKDEGTGDHAPLDDVFDVCCKAPVA